MELSAIKAFLDANKDKPEVSEFVNGLNPITLDRVKDYTTANPEGSAWLGSQKDSFFSSSLDTWKKNNLDKVVMEKVSELYPEESEDQKRIRLLEQQLEQAGKEREREALKNKALAIASEKKLPADLLDFFLGENEEATLQNIALLEQNYTPIIDNRVQEEVERRFKESGRTFNPGGDSKPSVGSQFAQSLNGQKQPEGIKSPWDSQL